MNIYSVKLRPASATQWTPRGVRVEAKTSKEASNKVLAMKGITEPCLTYCVFIAKAKTT